MQSIKLKVIEKYEVSGKTRYRVQIEGTKIVINVGASSEDEALEKARRIIEEIKLDKYIDYYKVKE